MKAVHEGDTVLQGRYRLLERIGRGGMGEVWRAEDEALGREVAVKCLKQLSPAMDPSMGRVLQERFRREARVAAALPHRGITVVHDFGEYEGVLFLVMELLEGRDLRRLLQDNGGEPLPVPDITDIALQIADALAYTHARGIVHRDLKPANVVRLTDGAVKICDFGIARLGHDIGFTSRLTGTGVAMGTPHYMSPEQIGADESIDHRSDLYSLGCVLYELATGAPPFDLDDAWAVLVGHRDTAPVPPREHRSDLPAGLDRLILDLLAKEPGNRPQSAADVAGRLAPLRDAPAPVAVAVTEARTELPSWARQAGLRPGPRVPRAAAADRPPASAAEALRTYEDVAAARAGSLGPDHPDTLAALQEAAYTLGRLGRHTEAHAAYTTVLAARERRQGADHPDTLHCRHNLAVTLGRLGRTADAHTLAAEVAVSRARVLGPDHPDTLTTCGETAHLLDLLGRWSEARLEYDRIAATRARALGPEHPETLAARHELGACLGRMGMYAEACALYADLAATRARVSGPDHPDTLRARHGLGLNLGRLGRWQDALTEARAVAEARARVLGADHRDTLVSRREAAVALGWLGQWEEALALHGEVAAARERVLGAAHPDTQASRADEQQCGERLGRPARSAAGAAAGQMN
ncbi:tetratricopeptide repeat protein [Streptomyces sp. NPDC046977]|uniref:serine/threonine-protein kinase n=1 Tax=Streptomyces sp. NPDC046977 TaxID=3154703 RepID=UPI0033E4FB0D